MDRALKILFVKPPRGKGPEAIDVSLGILYLSSYLKRHLKEQVEIELIDLRLTRNIDQSFSWRLKSFQPDIIGISLLSRDKNFLNKFSAHFKENAPSAKIVIGGPLVTYEFEKLLSSNKEVDWAVIGEGEVVFLNIVRGLRAGGTINNLPGIAYFDGKKVVCNPKENYITDLDTVPFPDYSLVNLPNYFGTLGNMNGVIAEQRYVPVISSRGCPFQCIYCHDIFGKKVRKRTPENFFSEIKWLYDEYGIREFHIVDDIFNVDRERMHRILRLIIDSGMRMKLAFPNGLRADMLERSDIDLLKQAGAYMLTFAVESASPRIQKMINKNLNINKVLENINYASRIGLLLRGFFMLGFPGETTEEIEETISFARKSRLDFASFFLVIPFKGTGLAQLAERIYPGLIYNPLSEYWSRKPFYSIATGYPLKRTQIKAYLKFYLPFRAIRTIIKMPKSQIITQFRWAIMIIFPKK